MNRIAKMLTAYVSVLAMLLCSFPSVHAERGKWFTDTTSVPGWQIEIQDIDGGGCVD